MSLDVYHVALVCCSRHAAPDSWYGAGGDGVVDCVWARGRKLVSGGRHVRRSEIAGRFRTTLATVLAA